MQQPSFVYSHLHVPQHKFTWQHWIPFHVQQQLHRPSASMRQRFCNVPQATSSSQRHQILQPVEVFSNSTVHRGNTHQFAAAGEPAGKVPAPGTGPENGATHDEPRSKRVDEDITQTPSKRPSDKNQIVGGKLSFLRKTTCRLAVGSFAKLPGVQSASPITELSLPEPRVSVVDRFIPN
jgi:hypothetical protein